MTLNTIEMGMCPQVRGGVEARLGSLEVLVSSVTCGGAALWDRKTRQMHQILHPDLRLRAHLRWACNADMVLELGSHPYYITSRDTQAQCTHTAGGYVGSDWAVR